MQRLLKPSSWPINGKLAFAFVISALIPIALTAYFGYRDTLDSVRLNRLRQLQQLAAQTAGRIDQLVGQASRLAQTLQRDQDVRQVLQGNVDARARIQVALMDHLAINDELQEILILDRNGSVLMSTSSARATSPLGPLPGALIAANARGVAVANVRWGDASPVLTVVAPITDSNGPLLGRVVTKVTGTALEAVLVESTLRGRAVPFVVDELGIILQHPDPAFIHAAIGNLTLAERAMVEAERRTPHANIRELKAAALAAAMRGNGVAGHLEHAPLFSPQSEATGYAPVLRLPWMVGVTEPRTRWEAPLRDVYFNVIVKVLLLAVLAALAGVLIFARDLVQPLRRLIVSAKAIEGGDYANARAEVLNDDEIGELTRTFNTMVGSIEKRERERDLFGRMVSPEVREKMLAGQLKLGGESRNVAVLFSDIRDFTTLCEGMSAEHVVEMLNEYLTEMTASVRAWDGYVNNFMGDAIMVVFGAPFEHPDASWAAVEAAFEMRTRLQALNRRRQARGEVPINHGIGIAAGTVVAGQMGSIERFQYTVIGDSVNVAARLEALTKEYAHNPILVTEEVVQDLQHHQWTVSAIPIGARQLKGRSQPTELYSVSRRG